MNRQIVNRRYRIERKIGEGGMSEVYLGFDIVLNRRVALKTLRPQFAANRLFRIRFEREAQAAAGFAHPNIIAIYDVGEDNGFPYIVMEYIEGQTLKEIIESEGPFHPDDVAILVEQVAAGLDFAHAGGLVHRDVKPQNVIVDHNGLAKVVDFGIAKSLSDGSLTEAGSSLGTVQYVSPEQASGLSAVPESDIYSLGVIAYEMLTGELPFESDTAVGIAMRHINDEPPDPALVNPDVPPAAADIVLRALSKNPNRRFKTAGMFATAMTNWRQHVPEPRPPQRSSGTRFGSGARRLSALQPQTAATNEMPEIGSDWPPIMPAAAQRDSTEPIMPAAAAYESDAPRTGRNVSWIAALLVVALIAGTFWYAFGRGNDDPEPTRVAGVIGEPTETPASTVPPRRTPTAEPTAEPTIEPTSEPTLPPTPTDIPVIGVPSVLDADRDAARDAIESAGLVFVDGGDVNSETVPVGRAIVQEPQPGVDAAEGDEVTVTFSSGPAVVDLTTFDAEGRDANTVAAELTDAGLNVVLADEGSASVPEGSVTRLEPVDQARPGDEVNVYVSVGDKVQIPVELQGEPLDQVRTQLTELGFEIANEFSVSRETLINANIPDPEAAGLVDGDVVGIQDNDAAFGGWVTRGAAITIIFYDADETEPRIVPAN